MKIVQILPEFHEGGVERHVLWLSNELVTRGHQVLVVSGGGKLEKHLDKRVETFHLPVYQKNPLTGAWSAFRLAAKMKSEGWQILHAHSRVPVWIAWWTSALCGKPWVFTAHDCYRRNAALKAFAHARGSICVSEAVKGHLAGFLPENSKVFFNGIPEVTRFWEGEESSPFRFLFLGRITRRKGLQIALKALGDIKEKEWVLDVVGDGPQREEMESLCSQEGIVDRVTFHGFRDDTVRWMAECSCFLFPSLEEGMGLTLMQAVRMGVPILASDLPPVRELAVGRASLLSPGDVLSWRDALAKTLREGPPQGLFLPERVPSTGEMAESVVSFYSGVLREGPK